MITIKKSDIEDKVNVCPYCMNDYDFESYRGCCGEVHYETAIILKDGSYHLESEVTIKE